MSDNKTIRTKLEELGFPNPKDICESEYSAIYDVVFHSLDGCEPGTEVEFIDAILDQFETAARELRQLLNRHKSRS